MNLKEYILGTVLWSLFCTMVVFLTIYLAAQLSNLDIITIETGRLFLLILLLNLVLTLGLVRMQK